MLYLFAGAAFLIFCIIRFIISNTPNAKEAKERCSQLEHRVSTLSSLVEKQSSEIQDLSTKCSRLKSENSLQNREISYYKYNSHTDFRSLSADSIRQETIKMARNISSRPYLSSTPVFQAIHTADADTVKRLMSVLDSSMRIEAPFDITAHISSESGHTYTTTLASCTCPDFMHRSLPCKHMYRLALEVGLLLGQENIPDFMSQRIRSLSDELISLEDERNSILSKNKDYASKLRQQERDLLAKENLLQQREENFLSFQQEAIQSHPWLAAFYADFQQASDEGLIHHLRTKSHPSLAKAYDVEKIVRGELRQMRIKAKEEEYQRRFYEDMFPWLLEFKQSPPSDVVGYVSASESAGDDEQSFIRSGYISHEEWATLSEAERNQLALDRYSKREKSPWQVGIEYERYIGYLCEQKGYQVLYNGAISGYTDMGRDLIAYNDSSVIIIQCKRWAKEKTIHEKHIFQLAGSVFEYRYKHPEKEVIGAFVTTIDLSPVAAECAELLGLRVYTKVPFENYPRIKCNIGKDGSKIYHLPMDQQYDKVVIDKPGEFYALTVAEAESSGFRRAYRWHTSQ